MRKTSSCPNCGGRTLYESGEISAGGSGHSPNYLPGLGSFFTSEKFTVVLCGGCGLARFFARKEAMAKVSDSSKWKRINPSH